MSTTHSSRASRQVTVGISIAISVSGFGGGPRTAASRSQRWGGLAARSVTGSLASGHRQGELLVDPDVCVRLSQTADDGDLARETLPRLRVERTLADRELEGGAVRG